MLTIRSSRIFIASSYDYSCVMISLPDNISQEIKSWCKKEISNSDVFTEGKMKGRELDIHCTVKYGLLTNNVKDVEKVVYNFGAIKCKLGEISRFTPHEKEYDVVKIDLISENLIQLNKLISKLDNEDEFNIYKPHVTVSYIKSGSNRDMSGRKDFLGRSFSVSEVIFSPANGEKDIISLI